MIINMKQLLGIYSILFCAALVNAQSGCNISTLDIRTGYNYNINAPFIPAAYVSPVTAIIEPQSLIGDPSWKIVADNNPATVEPRPTYVIPSSPVWLTHTTAQGLTNCSNVIDPQTTWIADYPTIESAENQLNYRATFEFEFCVNDKTNINLDLGVRADKNAEVYLNGHLLGVTANAWCFENPYLSFLQNDAVNYYHKFLSNNASFFNIGKNKIQIVVISDTPNHLLYSGYGLNVKGQVTGVAGALSKSTCCNTDIFLSGSKFLDSSPNGIRDANETMMMGWQINLKNSVGATIATATTDLYGFYFFSNVPTLPATSNNTALLVPGTYTVEEVNPGTSGFFQTTPSGNGKHVVNVNAHQVTTGLNFGNTPCYTGNLLTTSFSLYNPVTFLWTGIPPSYYPYYTFTWDFGDGSFATGPNPTHVYTSSGPKTVIITGVSSFGGCPISITKTLSEVSITNTCPHCLPSFAPIPGRKYVLGAWVSEEGIFNKETFVDPVIYLKFTTPAGVLTFGPYTAQGNIIDGWQRIEDEFVVPTIATDIKIELTSRLGSADPVYFDDVRIHPFDAGFKSYVYDPVTLKFVAELDNNNYATFYEYDEEGKLVRVKKETERKTVTIKESRNSSIKRP